MARERRSCNAGIVWIWYSRARVNLQRASRMRAAREGAFAAPGMRLMDERDWGGRLIPRE
jgi:hypothetical protein